MLAIVNNQCVLKVFVKRIQDEITKFPQEVQKDVVILFSAHSLPMVGTCTLHPRL